MLDRQAVERFAKLIEAKASVREASPEMTKGLAYLAPVSLAFAPPSEWIRFAQRPAFHAIFSKVPAFVPLVVGAGKNRVEAESAHTVVEFLDEDGADLLLCRGEFMSPDFGNEDLEPLIKTGLVARRTSARTVTFSVISDDPFHFTVRWTEWQDFVKVLKMADRIAVDQGIKA